MSAHDGLPRTSFSGIEFPAEQIDLDGEMRDHDHEYPHSPGGAPEKLGRKLYLVSILARFHATFPAYPDLYPNSMNRLRQLFEGGVTATFVHPTAGTFDGYIKQWKQCKKAKTRSGEDVQLVIKEDQQTLFGFNAIAAASADDTAINAANNALRQALAAKISADAQALSTKDQSIFDGINSAVAAMLAVRDTSALYGNLYAAKIARVIDLCNQADALTSMQDVRSWGVTDALHDVWRAAIGASADLQKKRAQLQVYTVPFTSSLITIATTLYGDASRASDLSSLNADRIGQDQTAIRANTQLRYYP
jgi:prophage DNA circulation protein